MVRPFAQALRYKEVDEAGDTGTAIRASGMRCLPGMSQESRADADHVATEDFSTMAFASRFIVLQSIAAAAFAAAWIAGIADKPFASRSAPMCYIILGIGAIGLLCVALRRWRDVQWIATHVVRIGLLGTVIGLIIAFSHATGGASGNPEDIKPMIAAVVDGMYVSLYATLFGIGTNLWLKINLRLLGNQHG